MSANKLLSIPDEELSPDVEGENEASDVSANDATASGENEEAETEAVPQTEAAPPQFIPNEEDERWTKIQNNLQVISDRLETLEKSRQPAKNPPAQKQARASKEISSLPAQKRAPKNRTRRLVW
jgi:hypothetical protein